jgi:hypothetical protein
VYASETSARPTNYTPAGFLVQGLPQLIENFPLAGKQSEDI